MRDLDLKISLLKTLESANKLNHKILCKSTN